MNVNKMSVSVRETTTTILKPTTGIAQTFTKEYLKILELTQYCRIAESNIKEYEIKIKLLTSAKNESSKLKIDYLNRNKINGTNRESLLQAKNELNKYKCELKSNYIATEKAVKSRRLKYKKIISSYESDWLKTLDEYNENPVVKELVDIQEKNSKLEKEIESQQKQNDSTRKEFDGFKKKVEEKFLEKIVEFSKAMVQYQNFLELQKRNREKTAEDKESEDHCPFDFHKTETLKFNEKAPLNKTDDPNTISSIDISIFDDILIPSENLEFQNEEDELFSYCQENQKPDSDCQEDVCSDDIRHFEKQNRPMMESNLKEMTSKPGESDVKESEYFRGNKEKENYQISEDNQAGNKELDENPESDSEKMKSKKRKTENEDGVQPRSSEAFNPDNEDSLSEGSVGYSVQSKHSDNIYKTFPELYGGNYENQYRKNSSMSSEDLSVAEPPNENSSSPFKLFPNEQTNDKPKVETEKDSFTGFFTMGGDISKPSIFKLF